MDLVLEVSWLRRGYGTGRQRVEVLNGIDLCAGRETFTAVMGPSGSGKTTLLNCIGGLDSPDAGRVRIAGTDLNSLDETERTMFRRERIGFVFQDYGLLGGLDVRANIELPTRIAGGSVDEAWLAHVMGETGIATLARRYPTQLSGGQQQRVAIARALLGRPELIVADEPTGALDSRTSAAVLSLLRESVSSLHQTIVMVTHDPVAASYCDRVVVLVDGHIVTTIHDPSAAEVAERMARFEAGAA